MKSVLNFVFCLALIALPFVTSTAFAQDAAGLHLGMVIERTDITEESANALEPVDGVDLDDCNNSTCETERDIVYAQGHAECTHTAIAEKTDELVRIAIGYARENCRQNGCDDTLICKVEREVVQGGYSCGVTVYVTFCCADCAN